MLEHPVETAKKVADLLIRSGLISAEGLEDAVRVAERSNVTLGRVLELNGQMKERVIEAAAILQSNVDAREMDLDQAIKVIDAVARQGVDLETALRQIKRGRGRGPVDVGTATSKVGTLMSLAGVVSPQQMKQALFDSVNTGLPLGMTLVQKNMILSSVLEWCLQAQQLIKDGSLTEEKAVHAIRTARLSGKDFHQVLVSLGAPVSQVTHTFGLGELLVFATAITESQLLAAREIALEEDKELETTLVECGLISEAILDASQQLLILINEGVLFEDQAATIIRKLVRCTSVEQMMGILNNLQAEVERPVESVEIIELIGMCRILLPEQLAEGIKISRTKKAPLIQTLVEEGIIVASVVEAAEECKHFIETGVLDVEQATIALSYAVDHDTTFESALNHFGWNRQLLHV